MSTDGNDRIVKFDPPAITVVSLFAAAGGVILVIVKDLKRSKSESVNEKMRLSAKMKVDERSEGRVPPSHIRLILP